MSRGSEGGCLRRSDGVRVGSNSRFRRSQRFLSFRARIHRLELLAALIAIVVVEALTVDATLIRSAGTGTGTNRARAAFGTLIPSTTTAPAPSPASCGAITLTRRAGGYEPFN